jgi:hypothetical protein
MSKDPPEMVFVIVRPENVGAPVDAKFCILVNVRIPVDAVYVPLAPLFEDIDIPPMTPVDVVPIKYPFVEFNVIDPEIVAVPDTTKVPADNVFDMVAPEIVAVPDTTKVSADNVFDMVTPEMVAVPDITKVSADNVFDMVAPEIVPAPDITKVSADNVFDMMTSENVGDPADVKS